MTSRFAIAKSYALDHLETLIPELFGAGAPGRLQRRGQWNVVAPWRPGAKSSQTVIWLTGARRGGWCDFVAGDKGDAIDLVAMVKSGIVTQQSRVDAVAWIEDRFGLRQLDETTRQRMEAEARTRKIALEAREEKRREGQRNRARKFFYSCQPVEASLAERYLFVKRGIRLADIPNLAPAFRFHPACEYWLGAERDEDGNKLAPGPVFPALISAMVNHEGRLSACHYTFLNPDGCDKAEGAIPVGEDEPKAKMMFPETTGLIIRATYGPSGLNMERAADAGISGPHGITEGIEDALSAGLSDPGLRMAAAGSLSGMLSVPDHTATSSYLIFKDNDWNKPQATAQFERAVRRFRSFHKPVEPLAMPASWGKDVNDALRGDD